MSTPAKKLLYFIFFTLFFAILLLPFIIGIWIKHEYNALINFYNAQQGVHIKVEKYQRHWFSADAELKVSLTPFWVTEISQSLNTQGITFPASLDFKVVQHIQNGPILYQGDKNKSLGLQLAYMFSEIEFSPELAKAIELIDKTQPPFIIVDNLSFTGKFQRSFRTAGFRLALSDSDSASEIELHNVRADFSVWPASRRIKAEISSANLSVVTPGFELTIPEFSLTCDRTQSAHGIWVGTSHMAMPQVLIHDSQQASLTILNLDTSGELSESGVMLNGKRDLTLGKVETGSQVIGPVKLNIRLQNFDADMSAKILADYGQMLFSSQYMSAATQIFSLLPQVINNQSVINIDEFEITTPNGPLQLTGKIDWPGLNDSAHLMEIVQNTQAQALLKVAVPLANRLTQAIVDLTYSDERETALPHDISDKKTSAAQRQNELTIAMLTETHQLPADAGANLLKQQKNHASIDDYNLVLESMVGANQINSTVAATLREKYAAIQWYNLDPGQRRANALKLLQEKLEGWVKDGYLNEDKTNYIANITYQGGQVSVNGKVVQKLY